MKRKRLDRDIWDTILERRYIQRMGQIGDFTGIVGLLYLDKVSEPSIWDYGDAEFDVCVSGMKWLQLIPKNEKYMITCFISQDNKINAWYIDMIDDYGFAEDGVVYYDDLYLDIGITPVGDHIIDDMDELEEAYEKGVISKTQFDSAIATKDMLMNGILSDLDKLYNDCIEVLKKIET